MSKKESKLITKHLKNFREIKGISKEEAASYLEVDVKYIDDLESNKIVLDLNDEIMRKLVKAYRFDINQIINEEYDEEEDESYYRVPVLGKVQCGLPIIAQDYIDTYMYLPIEYKTKGEYFYVQASGDSMVGAGIEEGDYLLMKAVKQLDKYDIGCFCFNQENGVNLKTYLPSSSGKRVILQSENDEYEDIVIEGEDLSNIGICGRLERLDKRNYDEEDIRKYIRGE